MADESMDEEEDYNSIYLRRCMEFTNNFRSDKGNFFLNIKIGDYFSFRVNYSKVNSDNVPKNKKYVSPSTRRRNNLHLLAFKARRAAKGGCSPNQPVAPPPLTQTDRVRAAVMTL